MSHKTKLDEINTALALKNNTQIMDRFCGYGPAAPGVEDWSCMLETTVDAETNQKLTSFNADRQHANLIHASQLENKSTAETFIGLNDMGMTKDKVIGLMRLYQCAWT